MFCNFISLHFYFIKIQIAIKQIFVTSFGFFPPVLFNNVTCTNVFKILLAKMDRRAVKLHILSTNKINKQNIRSTSKYVEKKPVRTSTHPVIFLLARNVN